MKINSETNYRFEASGGWVVNENLKPIHDVSGNIVAFSLPDGRIVVALEVEKDGNLEYVTDNAQMEDLGFYCLEYDRLEFQVD